MNPLKELQSKIDGMIAVAYNRSGNKVAGDVYSAAMDIVRDTGTFLFTAGIAQSTDKDNQNSISAGFECMANFKNKGLAGIDQNAIQEFVEKTVGITGEVSAECSAEIMNLVVKAQQGLTSARSFTEMAVQEDGTELVPNNMLPLAVAEGRLSQGLESFDAGLDQTIMELRASVAVTAMRYHKTITPFISAIVPTTQPLIRFEIGYGVLRDLGDNKAKDQMIIGFYDDPTSLDPRPIPLTPLFANKAADEVVRDGVVRFDEEVNFFDLSLDGGKQGFDGWNQTDCINRGARVTELYYELTADNGGSDVTEEFKVVIPQLLVSAAFQDVQQGDTYGHQLMFKWRQPLKQDTTKYNGDASVIAAKVPSASEQVLVEFTITGDLDRRNGNTELNAKVKLVANTTDGADPSTALNDLVTELKAKSGNVAKAYNLKISAKDSTNFRKADKLVTSRKRIMTYPIPVGRTFTAEYRVGQGAQDGRRAQDLANINEVIALGMDSISIESIKEVLTSVKAVLEMEAEFNYNIDPDKMFPASGRVRPYVITGEMDFSDIKNISDYSMMGDVQQRVISTLNAVISQIHANSYYSEQLPSGATELYRGITTNTILGNVLSVPHIMQHADCAKPANNAENARIGREHRMKLPSGAEVEFMTVTYKQMNDLLILVPRITGDNRSVLNGNQLHQCGSTIATATVNHGTAPAVSDRCWVNSRFLNVTTNPIGAIIKMKGMDKITWNLLPTTEG